MVEIECLVCGKTIKIPEFVDTNNYDGQVSCQGCASLLYVKLVGGKVRKYKVEERKTLSSTADDKIIDNNLKVEREIEGQIGNEADVENIAKYNPLRDFLVSYKASQLRLHFEQIESILGGELETRAYTFKSWWENDRKHAQAFAWLQAGWRVLDVDLPQRIVIFEREQT